MNILSSQVHVHTVIVSTNYDYYEQHVADYNS